MQTVGGQHSLLSWSTLFWFFAAGFFGDPALPPCGGQSFSCIWWVICRECLLFPQRQETYIILGSWCSCLFSKSRSFPFPFLQGKTVDFYLCLGGTRFAAIPLLAYSFCYTGSKGSGGTFCLSHRGPAPLLHSFATKKSSLQSPTLPFLLATCEYKLPVNINSFCGCSSQGVYMFIVAHIWLLATY